jgi:rhodanese-related sulfurtransferase
LLKGQFAAQTRSAGSGAGATWIDRDWLIAEGELVMNGVLSRLFGRPHLRQPGWIESEELQRRVIAGDRLVLLDVRQPEEFNSPPGHLPGARNVPLADVAGRIQELATLRRPIVVVCKTDRRSARAAAALIAAGLQDIVVLRGGTDGWQQRGFALE